MIVPNMSLSEVRKSVCDDYACEIKNKIQSIKVTQRGKWIRSGGRDFVETILFPVKSKNNWHITVACNKKGVHANPYLISYSTKGIRASQVSFDFGSMSLMHFNTHFFKRYRERGKITVEKPEDLVKIFFKKNNVFLPCYSLREDGTQQLFTPLAGGIGLGNYHEEADIFEFKTFVDDSLLREDQKENIYTIWTDTLNELTAEFQRRLSKRQGSPSYA